MRPPNQASLASVGTGPGRRAPTRFPVIVVRSPSSVRKLRTGQPVAVRSRRARAHSPRRPPGLRWRRRHCGAAAEPPLMAPTARVASREFGLRCRRFAGVGLVGPDGAGGAQSRDRHGVARGRSAVVAVGAATHGHAGDVDATRRAAQASRTAFGVALRPPRAGDRRRPWRRRDRSWPRHSGGRCAGQPNAVSSA